MQRAIFVAILSASFAATAAAQDTKTQGAKVFADQKCALCHSLDGKGNPKGPMEDALRQLSDDEIRAWITDAKGMTEKTKAPRKPPMKEFKLPKKDVDALVAYLSSMKKK